MNCYLRREDYKNFIFHYNKINVERKPIENECINGGNPMTGMVARIGER